ncbi:MAG: bacillithiol biosynthesis deacetylase BshB1 [Flavobacteriales bacterium]|nr:MAG: bacillithiol biosynthesis deacetylase BshB1 [Flavobacteriales bacterium]
MIDYLAIGAHPDDVELGCGGTIAKLVNDGKKVAIVDLTKGELGTRGTELTRKEEAKKASEILGVETRVNLGLPDGFLENIRAYQMKIVEVIRHFRPTVVFANAIRDRHPDHGKASKLIADACFLAGLVKIETEYQGEKQEAWRPKKIFNYIQWEEIQPDFVVDISETMDTKVKACLAYKTQFYDPDSKEPMTPIATKDFLDSLTYRAQNLGRLSGVAYAEGFTSRQMIAVKNFDNFIL